MLLLFFSNSPLDGSKIALWCYLTTNTNPVYKHYWTAGAGIASGNSEEQTHALLENYETELQQHECTLEKDCIRTWFFVQNVDVNYAGMVQARRYNFLDQGLPNILIILPVRVLKDAMLIQRFMFY